MLLGYTFCDFYHLLSVSVEMLLTVTLIPQFSIKQNWGKETVWGLYLSSFCVSKILFPLLKPANHNLDNKHLCNNCFLCQAQLFFSYLLSLMNHEQLARNYFNYMNQWRNTCFVVGRISLLVSLQKSINALQRALGFKRKFPSKSIITKFKQPWKIQLKWPL